MERKLASIQKIREIRPIEGADAIEVAVINSWCVVVAKKESHKVGDLVVYCEIDSFLPIREEFEFLRKSSYKKMVDLEGFRLRTVKLRGQTSQGLVLALSLFEGVFEEVYEGLEVTEKLGIIKYEPPIPVDLAGVIKGPFPGFIFKTDEERVQNLTEQYPGWLSQRFYLTEKLDGTSATYYFNRGTFGVCSRNWELEDPSVVPAEERRENTLWKIAQETGLKEKMEALGKNIAVQGEVIGERIQKNRYSLKGQALYIFNVFDIDSQTYYPLPMLIDFAQKMLGMPTVPILETEFVLPEKIEELVKLAEGKSQLYADAQREGLVVRNLERTISFKAISNKFLLENGE